MFNDKLSIINTALIRTGNNQVVAEGEATPEWIVASDAYETELPLVLAEHNWGMATALTTLERVGASPDDKWLYQYRKPVDCLHLISVLTSEDRPVDFDILDNSVITDATVCRAKYVRMPTPEAWPPGFIEVLRMRIMSHLYRGLNEDPVEAQRMMGNAVAKMDEVRSRVDQEKPKRAVMKSRLLQARLHRRTGFYNRGNLP
ncbi:MAG: hypothetical protein ACRCTG_15465 [Aestuariivirga sp.]